MPRSMVPIVPINGFQKEQTCLKSFQGKRLRKYISLESIIDLGHENLLQKRLKRLEPNQGQRHKSLTNLRVPDTNGKGPNKGWVPKSV